MACACMCMSLCLQSKLSVCLCEDSWIQPCTAETVSVKRTDKHRGKGSSCIITIAQMHLTFELQTDEVSVAQVLQKDPVGCAGLEVEGDVGAGLTLEGCKVQVGGWSGEGCSVPEVVCGDTQREIDLQLRTQH